MLGDILGEIREQLTFLESARTDPAYQVFASGRVQCPAGSKKVLWSPEQWWEAFNFVFMCETIEGGDDLLFFVYAPNHRGRGLLSYFVMRKPPQLPENLCKDGERFSKVDWCETVVLNLVLQTRYRLDVAVCGESAKIFVDDTSADLGEDAIRVSHEVFGSTTKTDLNPNGLVSDPSKSTPEDCFPDVCFAIHDYDEAFDDLLMTEEDQSYVVMLTAYGGALSALRKKSSNPTRPSSDPPSIQASESEESYVNVSDPSLLANVSLQEDHDELEVKSEDLGIGTDSSPEDYGDQDAAAPASENGHDRSGLSDSPLPENLSNVDKDCPLEKTPTVPSTPDPAIQSACEQESPPKASTHSSNACSVRAFAGSVECEGIRSLVCKEPLEKSRFVKMKGPGGHGLADVLITCESDEIFPPTPSASGRLAAAHKELKGLRPTQIIQKGLGMAARAARGMLIRHSPTYNSVDGIVDFDGVPLRCSLMTLRMPMHVLALRILNPSVS